MASFQGAVLNPRAALPAGRVSRLVGTSRIGDGQVEVAGIRGSGDRSSAFLPQQPSPHKQCQQQHRRTGESLG